MLSKGGSIIKIEPSCKLEDEHLLESSQDNCKRSPPSTPKKIGRRKMEPGVAVVAPYGFVFSTLGGSAEITRKSKLDPCYPISLTKKLELPLACKERPGKPKKFNCTYCVKKYERKASLVRHLRGHKKLLRCNQCPKVFWHNSLLTQHQRTHSEEKFRCIFCNMGFNQKGHMIRHQRIHSREKPYKCPKCPKSFLRESNLSGHVGIHTGDRPFKCVQCSKLFTHKYYLRRHFRTHTGAKPFHCVHCHKLFSQKGSLTKHIRIYHTTLTTPLKKESLQELKNEISQTPWIAQIG